MKYEKVQPGSALEQFPEIRTLSPLVINRWSSNNMMCVVEFEPNSADEQQEIEDIFSVKT